MTILTIQFLSSFWMMALIWVIQLLHYPLFLDVPKEARINYAKKHQDKILILVVPAMLIELATLIYLGPIYNTPPLWWISFLSLLIIWGATFFYQVPCHRQLLSAPTDEVLHQLLKSNWIRTLFWTVKTIAIGVLFFRS